MFEITASMVFKIAGVIFLVLLAVNWLALLADVKWEGRRVGDFLVVLIIAAVILFNAPRLKYVADILPGGAELAGQTRRTVDGSMTLMSRFSDFVRRRTQAAVFNEVGKSVPGLDVSRVQDILHDPQPEKLEKFIQLPSLESLPGNR